MLQIEFRGRSGTEESVMKSASQETRRVTTVVEDIPRLVAGDFLSREEFLRRWEAMPALKRAELIRGVVYMPSPTSLRHGGMEQNVAAWLGLYRAMTPGCAGASNATWLMLEEESPQPDSCLFVSPEHGGRTRLRGEFVEGAPEFLAEICLSSTAYDLHQKLEVYQEAGVEEYLAVLMRERDIRWHRLVRRRYRVQPLPEDGIYRSVAFPGLWLDPAALLAEDLAAVLRVLNEGIASPEHEAFVKRLASKRRR
jgi:Uma2 family endonuclease